MSDAPNIRIGETLITEIIFSDSDKNQIVIDEVYAGTDLVFSAAPTINIDTKTGTPTHNTISTGGKNVSPYANVGDYGVDYREKGEEGWIVKKKGSANLTQSSYDVELTGLDPQTDYEYRAYMWVSGERYTGDVLETTTDAVNFSVDTKHATSVGETSFNTGGENIDGYEYVLYHGVQYRKKGSDTWTTQQKGTTLSSDSFSASITGLDDDTTYEYRAYIRGGSPLTWYYGSTKEVTTDETISYSLSVSTNNIEFTQQGQKENVTITSSHSFNTDYDYGDDWGTPYDAWFDMSPDAGSGTVNAEVECTDEPGDGSDSVQGSMTIYHTDSNSTADDEIVEVWFSPW